MILNTNTDIIIMNPTDNDDISYFNWDNSELSAINKQGKNIYFILNDFESKRTLGDLIWFKWIWIDLDMQDSSVKIPYKWPSKDILDICNSKLWFLPSKVNRTFKWFHIFFKLSGDLYSLDREQYVVLYKHISKVLGGDPKMKDITAILKMEGFIDNKEGRKEFVIKNEFLDLKNNDMRNEITTDIVRNIIGETPKSDTKRIEDFQTRTLKRERNNGMFEDIDALDFIKSINEDTNAFKDVNIIVHWDNSIDETSGLKIYNDNWFHRIKDFSGKNRFGNRLFLYNYVIKEVMWITEFKVDKKTKFKDDNEKKEYDLKVEGVEKIGKIMWFLSNEFWIKYNKGLDKLPIYDTFIEIWLQKNEFILQKDWVWIDIDIVENFNNLIVGVEKKGEIQRVIMWLNTLVLNNNLDIRKWIQIGEKEFLKTIWFSEKWANVLHLRELVLLLSKLTFTENVLATDWTKRREEKFINLFDFSILHSNWKNPTEYKIKSNYSPKKKIWISPWIFELFKKPEHFYLATTIQSKVSEFWGCNLQLDKTMEQLWVSHKRYITWILKIMKEQKMLNKYEISWNTIYINKTNKK